MGKPGYQTVNIEWGQFLKIRIYKNNGGICTKMLSKVISKSVTLFSFIYSSIMSTFSTMNTYIL